ncbi:MAG: hypothetical protein K2M73_01265 [Lachnospiraceae bacterium]|nr:hypothetical protein [Lachnospiraceae bacterium]
MGVYKHLVQNLLDATVNNKWWTEPDRGIMDENEVILKMIEEAPQYTKYINKFFNDGRDKLVEEFEYLKSGFRIINAIQFKDYESTVNELENILSTR